MSDIIKTCGKCNKPKPLEEFRDNKKTKDKKFSWCKSCQDIINKQLYLIKKQKRLEQIKKWNQEHPEKTKEYKKKYRDENKEN